MIAINCTQCRQRLEMDEAFAGGVCRCQYCGTIQTVPSKLKSKSSSSGTSKKALYKKSGTRSSNGTTPPGGGTGLDELAEIVASSGLTRGSLTKPPPRQPGDAPAPGKDVAKQSNPMLPWLIGAGALVVVLLIVVIYLAMRPDASAPGPVAKSSGNAADVGTVDAPGAPVPTTPDGANAAPPVTGPAFADVPLPVGVVVYLIDRSQANDEVLDTVKDAVYNSVRSLGPFRRFQIIFWERPGEGIIAYPETGPGFATKEEVEAARTRFEDVVSYGTTDLKPSLDKATAAGPTAIVLTTAKGFQLDENTGATVQAALKGSPIKVHTFSLGEEESAVLKQIAEQTGGTHRRMSYNQLRQFAD